MRTNIVLDDELVQKADVKTKKDLINHCLKRICRKSQPTGFKGFGGQNKI